MLIPQHLQLMISHYIGFPFFLQHRPIFLHLSSCILIHLTIILLDLAPIPTLQILHLLEVQLIHLIDMHLHPRPFCFILFDYHLLAVLVMMAGDNDQGLSEVMGI